MELMTLTDDFQPLNPVENWESLIWTERYSPCGDFELLSADIANMKRTLPLESCVSLRESNVPMIVENHIITKPNKDTYKLKVTGRSYESVTERRASVNALPESTVKSAWLIDAQKESDAAYLAMRIVLGDVARYQGSTMVLPVTPPAVSPLDAIPEIDLTLPADYVDIIGVGAWSSAVNYTPGTRVKSAGYIWLATANSINVIPGADPSKWEQLYTWGTYEIKAQNLYTTITNLIDTNHRGIKAVRPTSSGSKVGIEIYNGADLTGLVVFDARFEQFVDATYLLSLQGSTNVAYVYGSNGAQTVLKNTAPEPSGLARRVLILDQSGDNSTSTPEARRSRGLIELYKYNATALFDGEIAEQVAAGYNRDYFLGDILKLNGEYGLSQNARVVEFIRSQDKTGSKAYPTFMAVDD